MRTASLVSSLAALACVCGLAAGKAQATQIMVGQCVESAACWNGPDITWSDTLSLAQLTALGLASDVPLVATQTSEFVVRLGVTTADFTTPGGPVIETLDEYSGNYNNDPGPYDPPTVVGDFFIPGDATGLSISGVFGNSLSTSSAGVNVCLGSGPCASAIPEASAWSMMLLGFAGVGLVGYRASRKSVATAA